MEDLTIFILLFLIFSLENHFSKKYYNLGGLK